ncbi:MAG: bifunctional riboflavin kinase/FAD synthetase [Flavobacteriales bacterium]|nr:bifunctional riboflavin kinase/FAD synthetase [Flavobacteriales bacterium]
MKVHTSIDSFRNVDRPVVTTGTFDGVHRGHRVILERLVQLARKEDGESVLFTFHPHPRMVLFPSDHGVQLLNTQKEKAHLLEAAGIDHLLVVPFSRAFSRMKAEEYVRDVLVDGLRIHAMVIGYDHRFGRNREGDIALLRSAGKHYGFKVEEIPAQEIDHVKVSSTKVRQALEQGDVDVAQAYLGYPYALEGVVVRGEMIGRTLGYPTANINLMDTLKLVPANGVYAVDVQWKDGTFGGMLNIGTRPTIRNGANERTIEVHVFDMDADLYGETLTVRFHDRIRDEHRFGDQHALREQLSKDAERARKLLKRAKR